jgi:hypothetical protein
VWYYSWLLQKKVELAILLGRSIQKAGRICRYMAKHNRVYILGIEKKKNSSRNMDVNYSSITSRVFYPKDSKFRRPFNVQLIAFCYFSDFR